MSDEASPIIGMQIPWKTVKNVHLRIKHVTKLATVAANGEVKSANPTMPYALLQVENGTHPNEFQLPITHRLDFVNLWSIYEERGISANEEVLVAYTPLGGVLGFFLSGIQPSLTFFIYPSAHLEKIVREEPGAAAAPPLGMACGIQSTIRTQIEKAKQRAAQFQQQLTASWLDHLRRGEWFYSSNRFDEALKEFDSIEQLNSRLVKPLDMGTVYGLRGSCLQSLGWHLDAIEDFGRAIGLNASEPDNFFMRGVSHQSIGELSEAVHDFERVIALAPHTKDFEAVLSQCRSRIVMMQRELGSPALLELAGRAKVKAVERGRRVRLNP